MTRPIVALLALAITTSSSCGRAASPRASIASDSQASSAGSAAAPTVTAQPDAVDARASEHDVRTIIGGMFAADHIGPEAHAAILARLRGSPDAYLATATRIAESADASFLSHTYVPSLISLVAEVDAVAARDAARRLLPTYRRALVRASPAPQDDPSRLERLDDCVAMLERLASNRSVHR